MFQFLTVSDWLYFDVQQQTSIALAGEPAGVPASADLCVRAATLLRETTNSQAGVTIYNDKRLPLGGGLGGGSSDAATTLLVLNRLWELDLPMTSWRGWDSLWGPMCRCLFMVTRPGPRGLVKYLPR